MDVVDPCTDSAVQGNESEFIPTVKIERGHAVEGQTTHSLTGDCMFSRFGRRIDIHGVARH